MSDPTYRKYFVYIDDGSNFFRVAVPAVCEEAAERYCDGSGEVVAIKDVTDRHHIDSRAVLHCLLRDFSEEEAMWMSRALEDLGLTEGVVF